MIVIEFPETKAAQGHITQTGSAFSSHLKLPSLPALTLRNLPKATFMLD